jgi:Flp pilus assembly protein TadD
VLAEAYLALGEAAKAEGLTDRRIQHFRDGGHRRALAVWLPVQAKVRRRQGQPAEAEQMLREAISLAVSMPYPHVEAIARQGLATLLAERRELDAARAELGKALGIVSRLGAREDAQRAEQALASLDHLSGPVR